MNRIVQYAFSQHLYSFDVAGWFNATEAAARFGKKPAHWLELPSTQSYMVALTRALAGKVGKSDFAGKVSQNHFALVRTRRGGASPGTWLHPKLAVPFARWLSDDFGVWCDLQIDTILRGGIQAQGQPDLLPLFLRADAAPWERRFPPGYYAALAKLTGTRYDGHASGTPCLFGQLTDRWVYVPILPEDVHAELKARRDKSRKMHQWLTDGGQEMLDRQITIAQTTAQTSCDLRDFQSRMSALPGSRGQLGFIWSAAA